jgi:hypothetical protein
MKKRPQVLLLLPLCLLVCSTLAFSGRVKVTQAGPTLLKRTVAISSKRYLRYWPNPSASEPKYNTWSWTPQIDFQVIGPVPGGSQWMFEVALPDGKPWVSFKLPTQEVSNDELLTIKGPDLDQSELEKKAIIQTGMFPFKITLKNALAGSNEVFFSGKFKVATYAPDQAIPEYKGKQEFYVVQDWRLPVGYIWYDPRSDENVPNLSVQMWFRGELDNTKLAAYIFYNGTQIGSTKDQSGSAGYDSAIFANSHESNTRWERWGFSWGRVRGWNADTSSANNTSEIFFMNRNPGEYEVKVLRDGELARSTKFTVGADGKLVDNGITQKNGVGGLAMILPVKVIGAGDGQWDSGAWKTEAFYGNPLSGFTAP